MTHTTFLGLLARSLVATMLGFGALGSSSAAEAATLASADSARVDAIVGKLDSDGGLDRAVNRAMTRVI